MDKDKLEEAVNLTLELYRLTDKFPEAEILKIKFREAGLRLLEDLILRAQSDIINRIRLIGLYLILAQKRNWITGREAQTLFENYKRLAAAVRPTERQAAAGTEKEKKADVSYNSGAIKTAARIIRRRRERTTMKARQESIVGILKQKNDGISFSDLNKELEIKEAKKMSPRTIRYELNRLIEKNVISQNGWARSSVYKLV